MIQQLAPAKINLFLDIEKRRKDGYHDINTLFLKLGLYDELIFKKHKEIKIFCKHPQLPKDQTENLIFKAAYALQQSTKTGQGAEIHLKKRIPVGAGLGGGSSDAAMTLIALNELWELKLSAKELKSIGKKIGADVPCFLLPDAAVLARGIGDRLKSVKLLRKYWIILVITGIFVATKEVYNALPRSLTKTKFDVKLLIHALKNSDMQMIAKTLFNRLETVTFKKHKLLAKVKKMISALGVRAVLMSGSGSVIFGIVKSREEAMRIREKLQGTYEVMVVRSL